MTYSLSMELKRGKRFKPSHLHLKLVGLGGLGSHPNYELED